jgi:hypothetical protein
MSRQTLALSYIACTGYLLSRRGWRCLKTLSIASAAFILLLFSASVTAQGVSFSFTQRDIEVSAGQNFVEKNLETQRAIWADIGPVVVAAVAINHDKPNAFAIATLPLRVWFWRLRVDGGGWLGTERAPSFGTKANFAARLRIALTEHVALSWLHLSNASLGRANPASDIFGLTWRMK